MKVLVTGATGYVGAAIVRRLQADGHAVRPFSRAAGGDISNPADVERAMDGVDAAGWRSSRGRPRNSSGSWLEAHATSSPPLGPQGCADCCT